MLSNENEFCGNSKYFEGHALKIWIQTTILKTFMSVALIIIYDKRERV